MIPFNRARITRKEHDHVLRAMSSGHISGDGAFTKQCHAWLERDIGCVKALLAHSCTAALETAAILADIGPGDEIIMPSFTFVSTANAFVLRGGVPVFVDIRPDTFNIDETLIEAAITPRTKAIAVVHYAGVACEMDPIMAIAQRHGLIVIEDAAQAIRSDYRGRRLGSIAPLAALSFHETKNVVSGEGGALLINDPKLVDRALVIREKGTNRTAFLRGEVDKYTWVDVGSSFLPSDLIAACLLAQLEDCEEIMGRRLALWRRYHALLEKLERQGLITRPVVPAHCTANGHLYAVLLRDHATRNRLAAEMKAAGALAIWHYIPLHSAPAGKRFARAMGALPVTDDVAGRILRLPLFAELSEAQQDRVVSLLGAGLAKGG